MNTAPTEFYRLDPLTGCNNFLSFVETLDQFSWGKEKQPFSILYTDMNYLQVLNETKGHAYGDSVIRWMEIVLREETQSTPYRIGGDEFAVLLTRTSRSENEALLLRIFARFNREGEQLGIPVPVVRISLVHYENDTRISLNDVMFQLGEAMLDVKTRRDRTINVLWAKDLMSAQPSPAEEENESQSTLRWIANHAIRRVLYVSKMLDEAQKTSFLDSISGLSNMRAALLKLEKEISLKQPFSLLLMDGDELTRYNNISYAAGDDMIQKISMILSSKLRPGDFIARWRTGDEFIAILPNTSSEDARIVAERFCSSIREASKAWRFPTSITVGIAKFPAHGTTVQQLVDKAECALKKGKDLGKDRVILAESF